MCLIINVCRTLHLLHYKHHVLLHTLHPLLLPSTPSNALFIRCTLPIYAVEQTTYESMAGKGQRVIACAMLELSSDEYPQGHVFTTESCPNDNLVFLGLVALQDPPKPGRVYIVSEMLCVLIMVSYYVTHMICLCRSYQI